LNEPAAPFSYRFRDGTLPTEPALAGITIFIDWTKAMPRRAKPSSNAAEIARIEGLIEDLEKRLQRLNNSAHAEASGASNDINQFVSDALEGVMERVRERTNAATGEMADRATRVSTDAYKRVIAEVDHYPLATLAVAAGIGFLLGSQRR
jgi:ElaB/YqjD/DUF883 family membrane-anchored ribosome-binding protein